MADNTGALAVLHYYFPDADVVRRIVKLEHAGGFSGASLWQVETIDGQSLLLRRFSDRAKPRSLQLCHSVLDHVANRGLTVVPRPIRRPNGEALVEQHSTHWELLTWMPGKADYHARPTRQRLRAAMLTLARFHELSEIDVVVARAPAVVQRETMCSGALLPRECSDGSFRDTVAHLSHEMGKVAFEPALEHRLRQLLEMVPARLVALQAPLVEALQIRTPLQPAIRDIHHDHVLFTGDEVTGLIDFGAMRVDTPLTDVARLVGSLVGNDQQAREFALDAYSELRPISEGDRLLIDLLDYSGVVLGGLNWLVWLYLERRDMGEIMPIIKRLDEIIARLSHSRSLGIVLGSG